jgi:predicted dehydrogenase
MKVEKLVVGVIGLGMGRAHLEGAVKYGAEIGLICDLKEEKLKEFGTKYGIPEDRWTTDWHDIVNNKDINKYGKP